MQRHLIKERIQKVNKVCSQAHTEKSINKKTSENTLHHSLQNVNKIPFAKWQPYLANHTFSRFGNLCTQQIKNIKFTSVIINHNYITDSIQPGTYVYVLFVFAVCFFSLGTYLIVFPSSEVWQAYIPDLCLSRPNLLGCFICMGTHHWLYAQGLHLVRLGARN